jgi:hypothetical protein
VPTIEELEKRINKPRCPRRPVKAKAEGELKKLKLMSPMSAEATVVRNYLDTLLGLPWSKKSKIKHDLPLQKTCSNEDHFGLDKVKERILEYLAVQQRVDKVKAPILCLVGPPGVGKTSLGKSIARATGRKFVRMSLGGVRDEAEIRGHRRTYIGSMPGKVCSPEEGGHAQSAVPARRDRQAGPGLPRRPVFRAARGAGSRAEPHLQRPLRRGRLRPVRRDVRHHRQFAEHPAGAAGPHGDHPPVRLHRGREGRHRTAAPDSPSSEEQRREGRGVGDRGVRHARS